jgi:hypothetical protein
MATTTSIPDISDWPRLRVRQRKEIRHWYRFTDAERAERKAANLPDTFGEYRTRTFVVQTFVDVDRLSAHFADKAAASKRGLATALQGAITVKAREPLV